MVNAFGQIIRDGKAVDLHAVTARSWNEAAMQLVELNGKPGDWLRVCDYRGNVFIEFRCVKSGHKVWWEEPGMEWGILIAAICQEREK